MGCGGGYSRRGLNDGCCALGRKCPVLGSGGFKGIAHATGILGYGGAGQVTVGGGPWLSKPGQGSKGVGKDEGKGYVDGLGKVDAEGQELGHGVGEGSREG